jgi:heterodisulfide reductase subunit A
VGAHKLDAVVIASCAPALHVEAARAAAIAAGLGEDAFRLADVGPAEFWEPTTGGSISGDEMLSRIQRAVADLRTAPEGPVVGTIEKRALVIGGGVAGIQAALDIADAGYEVWLVEKNPSIGGHMIQYSEVFPTLDCPQCVLTPKMVEVGQHPNITLMTSSEVRSVTGPPGGFSVEIVQRARKVDHDLCTGCGTCWENCPEKVPSEFDAGAGERKAIYIPFPQSVPAKPLIDTEHCRYIRHQRFVEGVTEGKRPPECRICERLCPVDAVDWQQEERVVTGRFGAIVVAAGFDLMPIGRIPEYAEDADVIDGIQFERLLSPGGPTSGVVRRPSDGRVPESVVFVSCAGSRDPEHGVPYCSRVCCMYLAKQALLYHHAVPSGQATVFYIDTRCTGKGYEEFLQRVQGSGVLYLRGKVSRIYRDGDRLVVLGADTLSGKQVEVRCDLAVLGTAMLPGPDTTRLAGMLGISINEHGFLTETHSKLAPLETSRAGIFLAGTVQGPKDIPDSAAQGSGAASKVLALFSRTEMPAREVVVTRP